ncbi:hypothetical protein LCGC14_3005600, partial [marine sediment metagenome]
EGEEQVSAAETALAAAIAARAEMTDDLTRAKTALDAALAERAAALEARDDSAARLAEALSRSTQAETELAAISDALDAANAARLAFEGDLDDARARLAEAEADVTRLREAAGAEATERDRLSAALQAAQSELAALSGTADAAADLREQLEAALAAKLAAERSRDTEMTEAERRAVLLETARRELAEEEAVSLDARREVAALNGQVAELRQQLGTLQGLLDLASEQDAAKDVRIETLGAQLNEAMARALMEEQRRVTLEESELERLERYQSEFFGRLRDLLSDREGVQIAGDRFVFSSEVLFPSGSAELSQAGRDQIRRVAGLLQEVSKEIPDSIDWVIRVDGHTDDVPLRGTGRYSDNWELSQG